MSRFLSIGLSDGLLLAVMFPYVPTPADVEAEEAEEGVLGMFLANLDSGTAGFASSEYQASKRVAL
jgi:hypothetical protein